MTYVLNEELIRDAIKKRGYKSLGQLCQHLSIHRNTLYNYLSGKTAPFPKQLDKLLEYLQLDSISIIIPKKPSKDESKLEIAMLIDSLAKVDSKLTFMLFGSRSKGDDMKYSDWDIGVYSQNDLPHKLYLKLRHMVRDFELKSAFTIDLVNLNNADENFLFEISKSWSFFGGCLAGRVHLQEKNYEK